MDQTQSPFQSQAPLEPQPQVQPQPQSQAQPQSPLYATAPLPQEKAPTLLLVISTLIIIVSSLSILLFLFQVFIASIMGGGVAPEFILGMLTTPLVIPMIVGVLYIIIALGFRKLKRWSLYAYTAVVVFSFLGTGYSLMQGEGVNLISTAIELLILFYLWSIQVRFNK